MTRKRYEVEVLFETGGVRRVGRQFETQKAARKWCEGVGMSPIFGGGRPSMYWTRGHGMQATIYESGSHRWIESSTEGRMSIKAARVYA